MAGILSPIEPALCLAKRGLCLLLVLVGCYGIAEFEACLVVDEVVVCIRKLVWRRRNEWIENSCQLGNDVRSQVRLRLGELISDREIREGIGRLLRLVIEADLKLGE
jgi:hypothetical protein